MAMGNPTTAKLHQDAVIDSFIEYLAAKLYPGLHVIDRPDKKPGTVREIDALAESPNLRVAIEHTSVDSLPNQRTEDAGFNEVIGKLEGELRGKINSRVHLITPFGSVPTGMSWQTIRATLKTWLIEIVPSLPEGRSRHNIEGVPFSIDLMKDSTRPHGLYMARNAPDDSTFAVRLREQLEGKADKLKKYKAEGCLTVLLVESSDIALMSRGKMALAIEATYSSVPPAGSDKIWYADTSIPDSLQFWNTTPGRTACTLMNAIEELENPNE
jgi:hypothetical protein